MSTDALIHRIPFFFLFPPVYIFKTRNIENMWNIKDLRRNMKRTFTVFWNIVDL